MKIFKIALPFLFIIFLLWLIGACADTQNSKAVTEKQTLVENSSRNDVEKEVNLKTLDYILLNQDGKKVNLYTDLLKDKIVIMNFIFTNCKTICDAQGKLFSKLQLRLGSRLGSEINLVSLSKDPKNDTPERLKMWGNSHNLKEGWTLLTGELSEVNKAFIAFTGDSAIVIEHSPVMLIGNSEKNKWIRVNGLKPIDEIEKLIEKVK